jgi:zinc transport system substrate-binding protein
MKPTARAFSLALSSIVTCALAAQAVAQSPAPRIVASTAWTGAIARAAGAGDDIIVIAPPETTRLPEYEPFPSELAAAQGASLVVFGGYEKFVQSLLDAVGRPDAGLRISTDNRPINLIIETRKIAERLGTQAAQEKWAQDFKAFTEATRSRVAAALCPEGFPKRRVAVQAPLKAWMAWMGFDVVGTFGPGELSPAQAAEIAKARPVLVIDDSNDPSGAALAESLRADYCLLINFPGKDGTRTLEDLYRYNERALLAARPIKTAQAGGR